MIHDDERTLPVTAVVPTGPDSLATSVELPTFRLEVIGNAEPQRWESKDSDRCRIGSNPSNDLVIKETGVSRLHCEIHATPEGARLRDLNSLNGTVVDGVRVNDAWLKDRSIIHIGPVALRFDWGQSGLRVALYEGDRFGTLAGRSVAMRRAFSILARCAATDATVLIQGETGTGKEGAAEAVHAASDRRDGPFVVVDCASIPSNLLESELFGHERGAFTGAVDQHVGAFEVAHGGTLFLDEIGELPLELQPKLLRVLEQKTIRRVGSTARQQVDVRILAATHRPLHAAVNEGRFRSDLYYRLAVLSVELPPLRERLEDIPLLVEALADQLGADAVHRERFLSPPFLSRLRSTGWPGNVRELRNFLERAQVFDDQNGPELPSGGLRAGPAASGVEIDPRLSWSEARKLAIGQFEANYLAALLELHRDNVSAAARAAGMDRVYLHRLLRRHGLR